MFPIPIISKYGNNIPVITGIKKYVAMFNGLMVLSTSGDLYAIGQNSNGMFGTGDTTAITTWRKINSNVNDVWASDQSGTLVRKNDGTWQTAGLNRFTGSSVTYNTYTDCTSYFVQYNNNYRALYYNTENVYIIDNNDNLLGMGRNSSGQLGTGNTTAVTSFTQLRTSVNKISFTMDSISVAVLHKDGTVYTCGSNSNLQLGYSTVTTANRFQQVTGISGTVTDVQMGYLCMYVLSTSGLYTCGTQFSGQLGNGVSANTNRSFAQQSISFGVPSKMWGNRYQIIVKIGTSYYFSGQNMTGSASSGGSNFTLIPASYIANLNPSDDSLQLGYMKLYALVNNNLYGSGNYNAGSVQNLLPYFTANVVGLQLLDRTIK
ncbi:hypothetical protein XaC1_557 [Xanthomonas phage XaC1]|nr:hypothetical protein XaC1_557 [Xanthomonas phage XaC1]